MSGPHVSGERDLPQGGRRSDVPDSTDSSSTMTFSQYDGSPRGGVRSRFWNVFFRIHERLLHHGGVASKNGDFRYQGPKNNVLYRSADGMCDSPGVGPAMRAICKTDSP